MFTLLAAAFAVAPTTDWGPLNNAAQDYSMCAHNAARKWVTSPMSTELIVEKAMASCAAQQQELKEVTRKTFEPSAPSQAELDASVERQYEKQKELLHDMLLQSLRRFRGR